MSFIAKLVFNFNAVSSGYLQSIYRFPRITPDDEMSLAKSLQRGDIDARNKFVESHLRRAVTIAKTLNKRNPSLPFDELLGNAFFALVEDSDRLRHRQDGNSFDPAKGSFATFISPGMLHSSSRLTIEGISVVALPKVRSTKNLARELPKLRKELVMRDGEPLPPEVINTVSENLGIAAEEVGVFDHRLSLPDYSLNTTRFDDRSWDEILVDKDPNPEGRYLLREAAREYSEKVRATLKILTTAELQVLKGRLQRKSMSELAAERGIHPSNLRKILQAAQQKIQTGLTNPGNDFVTESAPDKNFERAANASTTARFLPVLRGLKKVIIDVVPANTVFTYKKLYDLMRPHVLDLDFETLRKAAILLRQSEYFVTAEKYKTRKAQDEAVHFELAGWVHARRLRAATERVPDSGSEFNSYPAITTNKATVIMALANQTLNLADILKVTVSNGSGEGLIRAEVHRLKNDGYIQQRGERRPYSYSLTQRGQAAFHRYEEIKKRFKGTVVLRDKPNSIEPDEPNVQAFPRRAATYAA